MRRDMCAEEDDESVPEEQGEMGTRVAERCAGGAST